MQKKVLKFSSSESGKNRADSDFETRIQFAWDDYAKGNKVGALEQFIALIDDGCDQAYVTVGAFYERGCEGVEVDYEKARFYYERAIETRGSVEAYMGLARMYYLGLGVKQNWQKAFDYYEQVAREASHGVAYFMLGRMYQRGEGVEKDIEKAKEYYGKAISEGYVMGYTYLGLLENELGNHFRGWSLRVKAFFLFWRLRRQDSHHPLLRMS